MNIGIFFEDTLHKPKACNFIKKSLWHSSFPVNFCETSKNTFFTEHLRWLLLFIFKQENMTFIKDLGPS